MIIYNEKVKEIWQYIRDIEKSSWKKNNYVVANPIEFIDVYKNTILYGNSTRFSYNVCRSFYIPFIVNGVNIKIHTCIYKK